MKIKYKVNNIKRFWKYVGDPSVLSKDSCWNWNGSRDRAGYGVFSLRGRYIFAHRFSYFYHKENIDHRRGGQVCHKCNNPSCVNPEHLYLGTALSNVRDKQSSNRDIKGEACHLSKLTEKDILRMRALYPKLTMQEIALTYDVAKSTVHSAVKRLTWKHI